MVDAATNAVSVFVTSLEVLLWATAMASPSYLGVISRVEGSGNGFIKALRATLGRVERYQWEAVRAKGSSCPRPTL